MKKYVAVIAFSTLVLEATLSWAADLPVVTVVALDAHASEAGKTATLLFTREKAAIDGALDVSFTLSGTATPGLDYTNPGSATRFPPQVPMVTLTIQPLPDTLPEGDETVIVSLTEKKEAYRLGDSRQAQITISDASSGARSGWPQGEGGGPVVDPTRSGPSTGGVSDRSGTLNVSITLDGSGSWRSARTGEYADHKFHRVLSYTVPLTGLYGGGSGFTELDYREHANGFAMPNVRRYLVLHPSQIMEFGSGGKPCGQGATDYLDERKGMEVGDPGQPPLVPYVQTIKGGGPFPSGDKTVRESTLCQTLVSFDLDKHVYHLRIDGSDSSVKTQTVHNGHVAPPMALPLTGYDNGEAKAKLTFFDLPLPVDGTAAEGSRILENFSEVNGTHGSQFPLRATIRWRIVTQPRTGAFRS